MADWVFARSEAGGDVVKNEIRALGRGPMAALGKAMQRVAEGTNLPREDKTLGEGLRSVRTTLGGSEYRVIYVRAGGNLVALHALEKKTQQLPRRALDLAKSRLATHKQQP